jgi:hypothetical protein
LTFHPPADCYRDRKTPTSLFLRRKGSRNFSGSLLHLGERGRNFPGPLLHLGEGGKNFPGPLFHLGEGGKNFSGPLLHLGEEAPENFCRHFLRENIHFDFPGHLFPWGKKRRKTPGDHFLRENIYFGFPGHLSPCGEERRKSFSLFSPCGAAARRRRYFIPRIKTLPHFFYAQKIKQPQSIRTFVASNDKIIYSNVRIIFN